MDKLEQIKETIEESAGLLDKQQEYNFYFDEIIKIIQENNYDYARTTYLNPRLYNNGWYPETDVRYYWDSQYKYRTDIRPIWTNVQTTTSGSDAVVAMPRHLEEWCDFVTDDVIQF